jgi:uncharacterized protein (TIGR03067 family)
MTTKIVGAALMLGLVAGGAALTLRQPAQSSNANTGAKDLDLTGAWEVVELTRGDLAGKVLPNEDLQGVVDFQDDTFRFTLTSQGKVESQSVATFTLDPTGTQIDVTYTAGPDRGKMALGIIEQARDRVRICLPCQEPLLDRPADFNAEVGSNRILYVLRRLER